MLQISLGMAKSLEAISAHREASLDLGDKKKLQATLGYSLINTFWFHSLDKTFPPEVNLHHSEFTVKVLKWGTEGQVNTNLKIKKN